MVNMVVIYGQPPAQTPFEKRTGSHTPMAHSDCNTDKTVGSFISIWKYRLSRGEGFETIYVVAVQDVMMYLPNVPSSNTPI